MIPIGITCSYHEDLNYVKLNMDYIRAVEKAGGVPVLIAITDESLIAGFMKIIRGLILSGGVDVDPNYYGEEPLPGHGEISPQRDMIEIEMAKIALKEKIPILGICRGAQVMNIASGGSLYQNIKMKNGDLLEHMQNAPRYHPYHHISVTKDTILWNILEKKEIVRVNSFHQQVIKKLGSGFRVSAVTSDGVIEGLEAEKHPFALGVQWHPEGHASRELPGGQEIFDALIRAASSKPFIA
jgi:putative glutamine amidotransferase